MHKPSRRFSPAAANPSGGLVKTFRRREEVTESSPEMLRILDFVSNPANAHRFSKEAARKAFAHIKV